MAAGFASYAASPPPPITGEIPICRNIGPNSRIVTSLNPENTSGVSIGTINGVSGKGDDAPAVSTRCNISLGTSTAARRATPLSGVFASGGVDLSNSLISSIKSIGVIPQIASGENTLIRNATAPISLPSIYTGEPDIPPATPVRNALPPIFPKMTSCFGPHAFFHNPTISIGTASGVDPSNTVQATAFMPGLISELFIVTTGPAFGAVVMGEGAGDWASSDTTSAQVATYAHHFMT